MHDHWVDSLDKYFFPKPYITTKFKSIHAKSSKPKTRVHKYIGLYIFIWGQLLRYKRNTKCDTIDFDCLILLCSRMRMKSRENQMVNGGDPLCH